MTTVAANTISLAALVALYNTRADKPVKAFKDKPTATARVEKLAAEKDLDIQMIDDVATFVENVDPTEDAETVNGVDHTASNILIGNAIASGAFDEDLIKEAKAIEVAKAAGKAPKAPKTPKAPKAKKETSGVRGPAPDYADDAVVTVLVANPKRASGASFARFALYTDGVTVGEYLQAAADLQGGKPGKYRADLAWDVAHGFISIK